MESIPVRRVRLCLESAQGAAPMPTTVCPILMGRGVRPSESAMAWRCCHELFPCTICDLLTNSGFQSYYWDEKSRQQDGGLSRTNQSPLPFAFGTAEIFCILNQAEDLFQDPQEHQPLSRSAGAPEQAPILLSFRSFTSFPMAD